MFIRVFGVRCWSGPSIIVDPKVYVAKQRCLEYRGAFAFMAEVLQYRKDMFVYVDETGSNQRDLARKFGYAIRGEAPLYQRWLVRGRRISAIVAMTTDGVLAYEITRDSVNGDKFFNFVRVSLIRMLLMVSAVSPL